jgi:predicted nucleic acid-binding protein
VADRVFLDTNTLVHFAAADAGRAARVEALLSAGGIVSVQVISELTLACCARWGWNGAKWTRS